LSILGVFCFHNNLQYGESYEMELPKVADMKAPGRFLYSFWSLSCFYLFFLISPINQKGEREDV
jgi:hypothetical protein